MFALSFWSNSVSLWPDGEALGQGPREAGDQSVVARQDVGALGEAVATGQGDDPQHPRMLDQRRIEVGLVGQGQLEHHLPVIGKLVELCLQRRDQQAVGRRLVGAFDADLRLDDRHQVMTRDCLGGLELLVDDRRDPAPIRLLDERAHFGAEDALGDGTLQQGLQFRQRLHQLDAVLHVGETLVDLDERHDVLLLPQEVDGVHAVDGPVHRLLEEDRCQDLVAGEAGALDQPGARLMHEVEHLALVAVGVFGDPVEGQRFGGAAAALIQRGNEAPARTHLFELLFVHCDPSAIPSSTRCVQASRTVDVAATTSDMPARRRYPPIAS